MKYLKYPIFLFCQKLITISQRRSQDLAPGSQGERSECGRQKLTRAVQCARHRRRRLDLGVKPPEVFRRSRIKP